MKSLILFALLALALPAAYADSITTGDLSFTCRGGCSPIDGDGHSAPTSGSFAYDKSTKQFLNFTLTWDGMVWDFTGLTQANYLALIGKGPSQQDWTATCVAGAGPMASQYDCDGAFNPFQLFLVTGNTASDVLTGTLVSEPHPLPFPTDEVTGAMTATNLHDPTVTTPEPPAWILIIIALAIGGSILSSKWVEPKRFLSA